MIIQLTILIDFFCKIGPDLGNKITVDNSEYLNDLLRFQPPSTLDSWFKTNDLEIIALVEDININKSSNIEGLEIKYLKDCFRVSIDKLVHLFNLILATSIFPDSWKIATVTPLFKAGDSKKVSNYRPISLLPAITKLMEKLIHKRLYSHYHNPQETSNCLGN